jgi:hypothetical protein
VNRDRGYFECRYIGDVTDAEHISAWESFYESGDWRPGDLEFSNFSAIGSAAMTPYGIQRVAEYCSRIQQENSVKQRYLILAPSSLGYGLSRMFLTYCDATAQDAKYVANINEAQAYLDSLPQLSDIPAAGSTDQSNSA